MALVRIGDAVAKTGVSQSTLRRWMDSGRLTYRKTKPDGGHRLFDLSEIEKVLQEKEPQGITFPS